MDAMEHLNRSSIIHTMIPGTAGGTLLLSIFNVYLAIVSGEAFSLCSAPGVTMLGFRRIPSNRTLFSAK